MSAWIANLPLRRKLLLLCLFGLLMMAAPATMVLRSSVQELRAIQSERTGMPPSRALLEVVRLMQEHRGLSNAFLSGDATRLPLMKERQGLLDAALGQAQTTVDELGGGVETKVRLTGRPTVPEAVNVTFVVVLAIYTSRLLIPTVLPSVHVPTGLVS